MQLAELAISNNAITGNLPTSWSSKSQARTLLALHYAASTCDRNATIRDEYISDISQNPSSTRFDLHKAFVAELCKHTGPQTQCLALVKQTQYCIQS